MGQNYQETLKGQFLMAMPMLMDQNFYQTVTYICEYTPAGAVGIIVNRIHPNLTARDIFEELNMKYMPETGSIPIHIGGPVHMGEIFILHGPPFGWEGCLVIAPTIAVSNTKDVLEAVALGKGPGSFIIVLGCAGWGPGQLEAEIKENSWLISPVYEDIIFDLPIELRWKESMKKMGIDPALLLNKAGNA